MATHQETGDIENIAEIDDPVGLLIEFYQGNGYDFDISGQTDAAATDTPEVTRLVRGKPGNSWWSSNMTELHTRLRIQEHAERIGIAYTVEVSGQILKDAERAFWASEREAAEKYLRDPSVPIVDLRIAETARADEKSNRFFSFGLWTAVAVFMIIIFLGFVGII